MKVRLARNSRFMADKFEMTQTYLARSGSDVTGLMTLGG